MLISLYLLIVFLKMWVDETKIAHLSDHFICLAISILYHNDIYCSTVRGYFISV